MNTRRLILAAVFAFIVAWAALAMFAAFRSPPVEELRAPSELRTSTPFSAEEIAWHDRPEDCWLVVRGNVYDVTSYIPSHPAPRRTITDYCGTDSTQAFETKERGRSHSTDAWQLLESYLIGAAVE